MRIRAFSRRTGLAAVTVVCAVGLAASSTATASSPKPVTILSTQTVPVECGCGGLYAVGVDPVHHWAYVAGNQGATEAIDTRTDKSTLLEQATETDSIAVDDTSGLAYLPVGPFDDVAVAKGATIVSTVMLPVGSDPFDATIDPATGLVYVDDFKTARVSIIKGTKLLTSIKVGNGPSGGAVDPSNGNVYVANSGDDTVSVINGEKVVKTVKVAAGPGYVAVDPIRHLAYVADTGTDKVSILHVRTLQHTVTVGTSPQSIGVNPVSGLAYVANFNGDSVSILDDQTVKATVGVSEPGVPLFDPTNDLMLLPSEGSPALNVYSGTKRVERLSTTLVMTGFGAVDVSNGHAFVTGSTTSTPGNTVFELQLPTPNRLSVTRPTHRHYKQGAKVLAKFACKPGTNNVVTLCKGSSKNGRRLPTSKLGVHDFTVTMRSAYGPSIKKKISYRVTG
jgi:YVTN family beta-propeller protein